MPGVEMFKAKKIKLTRQEPDWFQYDGVVERGDEQLGEVEVTSVQRQQQEAKEVFEGELCGLNLKTEKKLVMNEGDTLEFFTRKLVERSIG